MPARKQRATALQAFKSFAVNEDLNTLQMVLLYTLLLSVVRCKAHRLCGQGGVERRATQTIVSLLQLVTRSQINPIVYRERGGDGRFARYRGASGILESIVVGGRFTQRACPNANPHATSRRRPAWSWRRHRSTPSPNHTNEATGNSRKKQRVAQRTHRCIGSCGF